MKQSKPNNKRVIYVNVCHICGSEKDLRPFTRLGSVDHVCRECEIKQVKAQAGK